LLTAGARWQGTHAIYGMYRFVYKLLILRYVKLVEAAGVEPICNIESTQVVHSSIGQKVQKGYFAAPVVQSLYKIRGGAPPRPSSLH
jgi:hypothetical protein